MREIERERKRKRASARRREKEREREREAREREREGEREREREREPLPFWLEAIPASAGLVPWFERLCSRFGLLPIWLVPPICLQSQIPVQIFIFICICLFLSNLIYLFSYLPFLSNCMHSICVCFFCLNPNIFVFVFIKKILNHILYFIFYFIFNILNPNHKLYIMAHIYFYTFYIHKCNSFF